jgi:hypothetical protein
MLKLLSASGQCTRVPYRCMQQIALRIYTVRCPLIEQAGMMQLPGTLLPASPQPIAKDSLEK